MEITLNEATKLNKICISLKQKLIPITVGYKLAKLEKVLQEEVSAYEDQITTLLSKYAEFDACGQPIMLESNVVKIKPEFYDQAAKEQQDLLNMPITVPEVYFNLEELSNLALTLSEIQTLLPFIKE